MTWKVSSRAAIVALVLMPLALVIEAGASQTTRDQGQTTAAPVMQPNAQPTTPINAYVRLFDKGDTAGDIVCTLPITGAPYSLTQNFKEKGNCANDEAVSISFSNIPAGSIISLYDDPHCEEDDDWVKFTFFYEVNWTYAHNLEINQTTTENNHDVFKQTYHDKNGLNGKVSCIMINVPEGH
jgi:hypothetical protein